MSESLSPRPSVEIITLQKSPTHTHIEIFTDIIFLPFVGLFVFFLAIINGLLLLG